MTQSPPHATPEPISDVKLARAKADATHGIVLSPGTALSIFARLRAAEARADKAEQDLARFTVNANSTLDEAEARAAGLQEEINGMVEQVRFAAHVMTENEALKARAAQAERGREELREALSWYADSTNWWVSNTRSAGHHQANLEGSMERCEAKPGEYADKAGNRLWAWSPDCGRRASTAIARDHARTAKDREP